MLTPKETGRTSGFRYPAPTACSALCESGAASTGAVAANATVAFGFKPTSVDTAHPLCDPTHHYLLTLTKSGSTVTVRKQDVKVGSYATTATTYAGLVAEALAKYAGDDAGYYSRLAVVESALDHTAFYAPSESVPGLWVPKGLAGLTPHTLLEYADATDLGRDSSGNSHHWTLAGATQSTDTPTNNGCTLNPLDRRTAGGLSRGNLTTTGNAAVTLRPRSGKWYYERNGVGVSWDADLNGPFDPVLTAGTYNFGATPWTGTGPAADESPLMDAGLPEPSEPDPARYLLSCAFTAPASGGHDLIVGWDAGDSDWLLILKNLDTAEYAWFIDTGTGLGRAKRPPSTAAASVLAEPVTASGGVITIPGSILAGGDTYAACVLRACAETGFAIVSGISHTQGVATVFDHGLGKVPKMAFLMNTSAAAAFGVTKYHADFGINALERFVVASLATRSGGYWHTVTATQFGIPASYASDHTSGTYTAYLFADAEFATVLSGCVGTGTTDGPYADLGGRPAALLFMGCSNSTSGQYAYDPERYAGNVVPARWDAASSAVEETVDMLMIASSGLKPIAANNTGNKLSGCLTGLAVLAQTKYRNAF